MTAGIVVGILALMFVVSFLQFWLGVNWLIFILFGFMIFLAFVIVKKGLMEYIYLIEKDRISFGRRLGRREKELLFVPLREIISFGPYEGKMAERIKGKKKFKFTFKKKDEWFVIDCSGCAVIITPTDEYIDCLRKARDRGAKDGKDADN